MSKEEKEKENAKAKKALEKLTDLEQWEYRTAVINLFEDYRRNQNVGNLYHSKAEPTATPIDAEKIDIIDKNLFYIKMKEILGRKAQDSEGKFADSVLEAVQDLTQASARHNATFKYISDAKEQEEHSPSIDEAQMIEEYENLKEGDLVCLPQSFLDTIKYGIQRHGENFILRLKYTLDEKIETNEVISDNNESTYLINLLQKGDIDTFNRERARTNHAVLYLNANEINKDSGVNNLIKGADLSYVVLQNFDKSTQFIDCDLSEAALKSGQFYLEGDTNLLYTQLENASIKHVNGGVIYGVTIMLKGNVSHFEKTILFDLWKMNATNELSAGQYNNKDESESEIMILSASYVDT